MISPCSRYAPFATGASEPTRSPAGLPSSSARRSLDFAQYDFHLEPQTAAIVAGAITTAVGRGVEVRFLYNVDHRNPIPVPPPPEPDAKLIASSRRPARAIAGVPDLMHHKYVVRDDETVWTGSMNWTDDSFSRQENVIVTATSLELATRFTANFGELGARRGRAQRLRRFGAGPGRRPAVRTWFTPGHGENLSHRIAKAIAKARRRVRICSPVITAAPVLGSCWRR